MAIRSPSKRTRARPVAAASLATSLELCEEIGGKGRGVFATVAFTAGDEVLEFLGEIREVGDFTDLTHALQIGPTTFIGPSGGIDDYVNHSCDPNTGIRETKGRIVLIALRPIADGDEITFDYSTTQSGGYWTMQCQCGAAACRGIIGDFQDLPSDVKARYINQRVVLPFLVKDS